MGSNNSVVKKEYLEIKYKSFRNIFPTPVSIYCPVCGLPAMAASATAPRRRGTSPACRR